MMIDGERSYTPAGRDDDLDIEDVVLIKEERKTIIKNEDEVHAHWKKCDVCGNRIYKSVKHECDFTEEEE